MIPAITNFAVNQTLINTAQNTSASLIYETTMKAIGRPGFILIDNDIDPSTKRYAAMKEFLYQATCLAVYGIIIVPIFKKGGFQLAKKLFKNHPIGEQFKQFKNVSEYQEYCKIADRHIGDRLKRESNKNKFTQALRDELLNNKEPNKFSAVKGAIEFSSLIGSALGLAILAPQVSHAIVHPVMKFLGFEKVKQKEELEKTLTVKLQVPPEAIKQDNKKAG